VTKSHPFLVLHPKSPFFKKRLTLFLVGTECSNWATDSVGIRNHFGLSWTIFQTSWSLTWNPLPFAPSSLLVLQPPWPAHHALGALLVHFFCFEHARRWQTDIYFLILRDNGFDPRQYKWGDSHRGSEKSHYHSCFPILSHRNYHFKNLRINLITLFGKGKKESERFC